MARTTSDGRGGDAEDFGVETDLVSPLEDGGNTIEAKDLLERLGEPNERRDDLPEFEHEVVAQRQEQNQEARRTYTEDDFANLKRALEATEQQLYSERQRYRAGSNQNQPRQIEYTKTPWGSEIPKNPDDRPVRVTGEHMKALGIDPEFAEAFEVMGNVLWNQIVNVIPSGTLEAMKQYNQQQNVVQETTNRFFNRYSDLAEHEPLLQTIQRDARERENLHHKLQGDDYGDEIARRTRTAIARMRGISLEQYEREVDNSTARSSQNLRSFRRSSSRAVSVGNSRGGGGAPRRSSSSDVFSDTVFNG
jgi:hypothetical protein